MRSASMTGRLVLHRDEEPSSVTKAAFDRGRTGPTSIDFRKLPLPGRDAGARTIEYGADAPLKESNARQRARHKRPVHP